MSAVIKTTIASQGVDASRFDDSQIRTHSPRVGDTALFEVVSTGKHKYVQNPRGANTHIYPGDQILAVFGSRYATQVLEGLLPEGPLPAYHLLGRGGVVGWAQQLHASMDELTLLRQIAYACDERGQIANTIYRNASASQFDPQRPIRGRVVLSVGSSMDSGKTTSAAYLCGGLKNAGFKVAFIKLTGTVFMKDVSFALDRGADISIDFSHFGYPSTYRLELDELLNLYQSLLDAVAVANPDYIVIEIADGLLQRETNMLLQCPVFMKTVSEVLFSSSDSLGALGGLQVLHSLGIHPFAISGLLTASPLLANETRAYVRIPIFSLDDLLIGPAANLLQERQRARPMELLRA